MTTLVNKTHRSFEAEESLIHTGSHPHPTSEHIVHFYQTGDFLLDGVSEFLSTGLKAGNACIIFATPTHRQRLEQRLQAQGLNMPLARMRGDYFALDAAETLSRFMEDGAPSPERFVRVVGRVIARAAQNRRHVRAFGELVALLWAEGNHTAAVRLEELWNELYHNTAPFSLFCAYEMHDFAGERYEELFNKICQQHSHVIPNESYSTLSSTNERLRAIALLQQQASSLQTETAERKQAEAAEAALRMSEERWQLITETMPQMMFTATADGEIDYCNALCLQFTGLSFEQLRSWGWTQIVHPDELQEDIRRWKSAIESGEPFYAEQLLRRADGVYRWHVSRAIPLRDAQGAIMMWIGSSTDIDEQKRLEERKNAFISMASHELKTPVTSLRGFTQILQRRLKQQADDQTLLFLDRIEVQLKKLTTLISDLLDVSRMQTGTLAFRETSIDLDELVRETVENVQATTTHQLSLQGATQARVFGDRDRLGQVFINLLTNAIKYSPQAEKVIVRLSSNDQEVVVAVQDFGIGIAEEHHERIFERLYQVSGPQEKAYPGLGIGLYIARQLSQRHGGRLWLESRKGAGSTFYVSLPRLPGDAGVSPAPISGEAAL